MHAPWRLFSFPCVNHIVCTKGILYLIFKFLSSLIGSKNLGGVGKWAPAWCERKSYCAEIIFFQEAQSLISLLLYVVLYGRCFGKIRNYYLVNFFLREFSVCKVPFPPLPIVNPPLTDIIPLSPFPSIIIYFPSLPTFPSSPLCFKWILRCY